MYLASEISEIVGKLTWAVRSRYPAARTVGSTGNKVLASLPLNYLQRRAGTDTFHMPGHLRNSICV